MRICNRMPVYAPTVGTADAGTQEVMVWFRRAARTIREEYGCSPARVAADRDVSESTIRRFEKGRDSTEIDLDAMIAAYSRCTGVPVVEFVRRALELMERLDG